MAPEHIKDRLKLQIAINALLELRQEATSGSLEMCTIDATLDNLGVGKEYIHTFSYLHQFPTKITVNDIVLSGNG